ncbi:hypothetical protein UFOVP1290_5 [uncultured Caudovirales phage]|uniref:Uncharacterized protein n=1 Tax=uncultured Caudovirales phage TaxID=2100421 RepID=A0A6J5RW65_9CAUD|nr:hypothetical protein UFOVP1290_5 [uncultured Caudovirales phage]
MPFYTNPILCGTDAVSSLGDGYTINIKWFKAYPSIFANKILYHIYFSTIKEDVFADGVKYISAGDSLDANIIDLTPGQEYFFAVRPVEYNPDVFNPSTDLPLAYDELRFYPTSILRQDITATSLLIPLVDVGGFPNSGIIKVGVELIQYLSVDQFNNNLVLTDISQRGINNTPITIHNVDGYDGYVSWDPTVTLFVVGESLKFDKIFVCQCRFEYSNYQFTNNDGYHQVIKDLLNTDLHAADDSNITFPMYDFAGYHRTDPVQLLNGTCVGSYIGGEQGCIDKYGNVNILRGMSVQDQNLQRQEILLSVTGRDAILIKRVQTGITCACYSPSREYSDDRCPICFGSHFIVGYEQYFNPRSSDGRIKVRPGPTDENTKMYDSGLESEFPLNLWTLAVPTLKTRDVLVLFDQEDNEEFRYEIMAVTRNNTTIGQQGGQHFKVMRIRKFDPAYQIRIFRNTSMFPSKLNTGIGLVAGKIPPHTHEIVINEKITSITQINQVTSVSQGHNHQIVDGVIMPVLSHDHKIIL